jgi:hypothetical protein
MPVTDADSIERMILKKVGDLPRQVEVFQKRLAGLAEESMARGQGEGISEQKIAKMIEEKLAGGGPSLGQDEMAALVVTQVDMRFSDLFSSDEFKKAVQSSVSMSADGSIDKDQLEQGLRAFVQLEIRRVTQSTKEIVSEMLDSDSFAAKVRELVPAGGGGEGAPAAIDQKTILEHVKKALDTKEINLKIAQKFLEVMTYVKSEVPKLVASALKK